jgi:hypothetical protein
MYRIKCVREVGLGVSARHMACASNGTLTDRTQPYYKATVAVAENHLADVRHVHFTFQLTFPVFNKSEIISLHAFESQHVCNNFRHISSIFIKINRPINVMQASITSASSIPCREFSA